MTNNRKIVNSVFKELIVENLIPTDVSFGNGYFIFEMGEDSVVHFHIKGAKGWRFGMWIDTSLENDAIQFFAQYEETIDKFKPSRSLFAASVSRKHLKEVADDKRQAGWIYLNIIKIAKHIATNPKLAFIQENHYSLYLDEPMRKLYISNKLDLYKNRLYKIKKHITDDFVPYCINSLSVKIVKSWHDEMIKDIELIDCNDGMFICSPRWEVKTYYNRISDKDNIQAGRMRELTDRINKFRFLFTTKNTSYTDLVPNSKGSYDRW